MAQHEARSYLESLLNQRLRVYTTDGRLFWGSMKCTDADMNVVLANTYEYRQPSARSLRRQMAEIMASAIKADMTSRYLGLVVVPGPHIIKMELEQFQSQMRDKASKSNCTTTALARASKP